MASFSYDNTPKTAIMEAWEFEKISSDYCSQTNTLMLFNREEFTKNAEVLFILNKLIAKLHNKVASKMRDKKICRFLFSIIFIV